MKDEKGLRHSRNGRLNQARGYAGQAISALDKMQPLHGGAMFRDAGWEELRVVAEKMLKCVHEANAYNNSYSERDDVRGRTPGEEEQRRSFVYGNCAIENPNVTRELVDRVADTVSALAGKGGRK